MENFSYWFSDFKQRCSMALLSRAHLLAFKKKMHTYPTHNYVFSHTETCYLKHNTKHFFFLHEYYKQVFLQHFLNHSFRIILNNDIRNLHVKKCFHIILNHMLFKNVSYLVLQHYCNAICSLLGERILEKECILLQNETLWL